MRPNHKPNFPQGRDRINPLSTSRLSESAQIRTLNKAISPSATTDPVADSAGNKPRCTLHTGRGSGPALAAEAPQPQGGDERPRPHRWIRREDARKGQSRTRRATMAVRTGEGAWGRRAGSTANSQVRLGGSAELGGVGTLSEDLRKNDGLIAKSQNGIHKLCRRHTWRMSCSALASSTATLTCARLDYIRKNGELG